MIDSLQLTAKHKVATPVQWQQGDDVIIAGSVSDDEAQGDVSGRLGVAEALHPDRRRRRRTDARRGVTRSSPSPRFQQAEVGRLVGSPSKYRSRTARNTGSSGAARANSVIDERSLIASIAAEDLLRAAPSQLREDARALHAAAAPAPDGPDRRVPRRATRSRSAAPSGCARAPRSAGTRTTSSGRSCARAQLGDRAGVGRRRVLGRRRTARRSYASSTPRCYGRRQSPASDEAPSRPTASCGRPSREKDER